MSVLAYYNISLCNANVGPRRLLSYYFLMSAFNGLPFLEVLPFVDNRPPSCVHRWLLLLPVQKKIQRLRQRREFPRCHVSPRVAGRLENLKDFHQVLLEVDVIFTHS